MPEKFVPLYVQKSIVCALMLLFAQVVFGQQYLSSIPDTVKLSYRVGGASVDSMDQYHAGRLQTTPGGAAFQLFGAMQSSYQLVFERMSSPFTNFSIIQQRFTALPHLGFSYTFGSRGAQFMHAEYQHQLRRRLSLQMEINQQNVGELLRNGTARNREIQLLLRYNGIRYINLLEAGFAENETHFSGGLIDTASAKAFDLRFLPVNNEQAFSQTKQVKVNFTQAFNFLKDSTRFFGIAINNVWQLRNRVFRDSLLMTNKYTNFFIDSVKTRDQFQVASLNQEAGIHFHRAAWRGDAAFVYRYWDYQNLGQHRDTVETGLALRLNYQGKKFKMQQKASYNLSGAGKEKMVDINLSYAHNYGSIIGKLNYNAWLPDPWQRFYLANSVKWQTDSLILQTQLRGSVSYELKHQWKPYLGLGYMSRQNTYWFDGASWRNDTLENLQFFQVTGGLCIPFGPFKIALQGMWQSLPANFTYMPQWELKSRIGYRNKLFKAKKFDYFLMCDVRYQSSYELSSFHVPTGIYVLPISEPGNLKVAFPELDVLTGFEIDEFRFYFKLEHLEYLWVDRDIQYAVLYPISPMMLRIGISWDFFN